ncbi:MAG: protein translocase subunit SecF [Spirochaetaceae bacterium]|nr:protein translocase subunit SecF [Spirochaetaceae bacterium]MCF7948314.1 protein translocase subunit SecF [Spirochaetia bacterium]MCF7951534.1 protein translocase subunit SecF [Spirochaetaceae bacterium]
MTKMIRFTKLRYYMIAVSVVVIIAGIAATVGQGGFNLGIDFQAGLNQRVQVAPVGFTVSYTGEDDATLNVQGETMIVEVRGEEGVNTYELPFSQHGTLRNLTGALDGLENISTELIADQTIDSSLIVTGLRYPQELGDSPVQVNVRNDDPDNYLQIQQIRDALDELKNPQVQVVGTAFHQEYLVRVEDPTGDKKDQLETDIRRLLEESFGNGSVVIKSSEYVGPRFSQTLAQQSFSLTLMALVLILIYIWFRFQFGYAISAIVALTHDVLVVLGFIGATQLEVSTTTIAAVLTIIGYSLNDTIVIFDRIRENEGLLQGRDIEDIINTSITQSLSRTLITSLTTLLAVTALYTFGTGAIKDFALNLIVGIIVGTYSSVFVASPMLLGWRRSREKRQRIKRGLAPKATKAEIEEKAAPAKGEAPAVEKAVKSENIEIPSAERKQKGKRKKRKKK